MDEDWVDRLAISTVGLVDGDWVDWLAISTVGLVDGDWVDWMAREDRLPISRRRDN